MRYVIRAKFGLRTERFEFAHSTVKKLEEYLSDMFDCKVKNLSIVSANGEVTLLVKEKDLLKELPRANGGVNIHVNSVERKNGEKGTRLVVNDEDIHNEIVVTSASGCRFLDVGGKQECKVKKLKCNQDISDMKKADKVCKENATRKKKTDKPTSKAEKIGKGDGGNSEYCIVDIGEKQESKGKKVKCDETGMDKKKDVKASKDAPEKMKKGNDYAKDEKVDAAAHKKKEKKASKEKKVCKDDKEQVGMDMLKMDPPKPKVDHIEKVDDKYDEEKVGKGKLKMDAQKLKVDRIKKPGDTDDGKKEEKRGTKKKEVMKPKRMVVNDSDCEKENCVGKADKKCSGESVTKSSCCSRDNTWYKLQKRNKKMEETADKTDVDKKGCNVGNKKGKERSKDEVAGKEKCVGKADGKYSGKPDTKSESCSRDNTWYKLQKRNSKVDEVANKTDAKKNGSDVCKKQGKEKSKSKLPTKELKIGDQGEEVEQLQTLLLENGYLAKSKYEEGKYDCRTALGVKELREAYGPFEGNMMEYNKDVADALKMQMKKEALVLSETKDKKGGDDA